MRERRQRSNDSAAFGLFIQPVDNISFRNNNAVNFNKRGNRRKIKQDLIELLPVSIFTQLNKDNFSEENKMCNICIGPYEIGDQYMILPCLHRFHPKCIKEWLGIAVTCPNCMDRVIDHLK